MKLFFSILLHLFLLGSSTVVFSAPSQDIHTVTQVAADFLTQKALELSDNVKVEVTPIDNRTPLAACDHMEAFFPPGGRIAGRTSVGIKCFSPTPWTIYTQANIAIITNYVAAIAHISSGQLISNDNITVIEGDLASLPRGVITDPNMALGRISTNSIRAGMPIRQELLKQQPIIQQGQTVRILSSGPGFEVTMDGIAITSASEGQIAKAKTANGQVVSGLARSGGIIEIQY